MKRTISFLVLIWITTGSVLAQGASGIKTANLKNADLSLMTNHDPAVEQANFQLLPGYEVNLFASEPMLANPVHMVWDSRGRLWVACSWAYPQLKPGEIANDKIIILEDTDGDGQADKSTVFAEGLYMPTGLELANGGCYVAQTPDVFFLKDTDGDDVADVKALGLTGFGIEDSHHSVSAWRRGPGGWLYFQEGIFLHTQVETQYGVVRNYNGGVYQFNPRSQELRVFAKIGVGNPWGHVFDRWGQSFFIDNPRISYLSPSTGNSGEKVRLAQLIKTEKQCGGDLASGTHLPEDIRGQLLTCRFKSRTVIRYELLENGAGFSANVLEPLIASKHPNFRPVDCKMGPDGAVYVADWYNSVINHAQHNFRDPRRDHEHGRIWRITAKDRPLVKKPSLVDAPIPELLDHLKSPESWIRHQARLELSEQDHYKVSKAVNEWVENLNPNETDYEHHLVEAMWACQNVEGPSEAVLKRVMAAKDGHARAAGARVIRYWHAQLSDPVAMIAKAAGDSFPRVRMEAILSAGFIPKAEAFPAALIALDSDRDSFIDVVLPQTVKALEPYWRPALKAGMLEFAKAAHREFAEREAGIGFDQRLATFLKKKPHNSDEIADIKAQLVASGNLRQARMVVGVLAKPNIHNSPEFMVGMLDALNQIGRTGELSLGRKMASLRKHLANQDDAIAAGVAANLGIWKTQAAGPDLVMLLHDEQRAGEVRQAAAVALGNLGRPEFVKELKDLAVNGDLQSRYLAIHGLAIADLEEAASTTAALLSEDPGLADPVALVTVFVNRDKGAGYLSNALAGTILHPAVLERVARYHRRTGQLPSSLEKWFRSKRRIPLSKSLIRENRNALTADVEELGDPSRGEFIFRRQSSACAVCHGIGPVGPAIGPNLVAVGAAASTEYMVEAILEPNKSIAEHYENMMITTRDNEVYSGVILFKSEKEIVIRDSTEAGNEIRIPVTAIKKMKPIASLMPSGLADQLQNRQEFLDLAKFISMLGRPGSYSNDESPIIRKWELATTEHLDQIPDEDAFWTTAYSLVNGKLPLSDIDGAAVLFARGFVNVQVAGSVNFVINDTKGLRLWVDGREVSDFALPIQLSQGRRNFTFSVNRSKRDKIGLRVELTNAPGSMTKFTPEGGI